jgi:hypothetical protein
LALGFWSKETILFSLEEKSEINLKNIEKITLRGLGSEAIEGLKSAGNLLEVKVESINHLLYVIVDKDFICPRIGIPVNGIIGSPFFRIIYSKLIMKKEKLFL